MPRLIVTLKGSPTDHRISSPEQSQEDCDQQLSDLHSAMANQSPFGNTVRFSWGLIRGNEVKAVLVRTSQHSAAA